MSVAALTLAVAVAGAGASIDVVFLPDDAAAPPLVVRVSQQGAQRTVAWVVASTQPASGARSDAKGARRSLLALPGAPTGAALADDGATLVVTIDDAGDWARRYPDKSGRARVAGVSVSGERALRLVVPALGAPAGPATLVGARVRVSGTGVALPAMGAARALVRSGAELVVTEPTVVDGVAACGAIAAASWSSDRPPLRLLAEGNPVCVGAMAVARVTGVRLSAPRDVPVAGVVIATAP